MLEHEFICEENSREKQLKAFTCFCDTNMYDTRYVELKWWKTKVSSLIIPWYFWNQDSHNIYLNMSLRYNMGKNEMNYTKVKTPWIINLALSCFLFLCTYIEKTTKSQYVPVIVYICVFLICLFIHYVVGVSMKN